MQLSFRSFFTKVVWIWVWALAVPFVAFMFLIAKHPVLAVLSIPAMAGIAVLPFWSRSARRFTRPPVSMKKLVGYTLTVAVLLWGLVYKSLEYIAAVRPYTTSPMAALKYTPLEGSLAVVGLTFFCFLMCLLTEPVPGRASVKEALRFSFFLSCWVIAILWPFIEVGQASTDFLSQRVSWRGSCVITQEFVNEHRGIDLQVSCGKQGKVYASGDQIVNTLLSGKRLTCTTNAAGITTCLP